MQAALSFFDKKNLHDVSRAKYNCVAYWCNKNILACAYCTSTLTGKNLKIFQRLQIFNRVRSENAHALEKLCQVAGDVLKPTLGLSDVDLHILRQEVSVVIHTAATVRFNECISLAVEMNTLGTRRVIELCKQLPLLQVMHIFLGLWELVRCVLIFCSANTGFCAHVDSVLERRQAGGVGKSLRAPGGPRCFD
jgi:Male sterility protein